IVSVYPPYTHFLDELYGPADGSKPRRVVCVTDSITINSIWYRCSADYFLLANEQTGEVLASAGIDRALIRVFGFPVSPRFAALHVLVSKAGGATVQETIAAACPMIINQVVPGQEEGNAQLITQSHSGTVALSNDEVIATLTRAFADDGKLLQEWSTNIAKI